MKAEIKKGTGSIEDIIREHAAQKPEERLEEKTTGDNILEEVMKKYEEALEKDIEYLRNLESYISTMDYILTPGQINSFLQVTVAYEQHRHYTYNTGRFVTKLIQNSYDAGNNDFFLNTENLKRMYYIGHRLEGKPDNKIRVMIQGSTGERCGEDSSNSIFNIRGSTEKDCGLGSKGCEYSIQGDTGKRYGAYSTNSTFIIQGSTGEHCGIQAQHSIFSIGGSTGHACGADSKHCEYSIGGNIGDNCGNAANDSTFKTTNLETLKKMKRDVPRGNRIIFIESDGTQKMVTKVIP